MSNPALTRLRCDGTPLFNRKLAADANQ